VSDAATTADVPAGATGGSLTDWLFRFRELGIVAALVLLFGVTAAFQPGFLAIDSLRDLILNASIFVVLAVGQTLVILTRNIDLSVGSILALSAFMAGDLFLNNPGIPVPLVFVLGMTLGAVAGGINAFLTTFGRVPALVVTLGTLYVFRGIAFLWTDGRQINAEDLPNSFLDLGTANVLGFPLLGLIAIVVTVVVGLFLRDFRYGR
jgi:rhamnose transport system permease protein